MKKDICLLVCIFTVCLVSCRGSSASNRAEQGQHLQDKSKTITFLLENATIVDLEGSHTFESFDSPNMNVTDNGSSVKVAWGGTEVILKTTTSNSDTYYCEGETSKGKIAVTAYRSSRSGEIYLVTVQMPNPSPNVNFITINFKP